MKGEERKTYILNALDAQTPVSAGVLAAHCGVSRQVIVQDVAVLRAEGAQILSTPRGYLLVPGMGRVVCSRVFKVRHEDERTEEELNLIVDKGGYVKNVFVHHRVYGRIEAALNVGTRVQTAEYMRSITEGKSKFLKNVTSGYHYHTVTAASEEILDEIELALRERGFLVER